MTSFRRWQPEVRKERRIPNTQTDKEDSMEGGRGQRDKSSSASSANRLVSYRPSGRGGGGGSGTAHQRWNRCDIERQRLKTAHGGRGGGGGVACLKGKARTSKNKRIIVA